MVFIPYVVCVFVNYYMHEFEHIPLYILLTIACHASFLFSYKLIKFFSYKLIKFYNEKKLETYIYIYIYSILVL